MRDPQELFAFVFEQAEQCDSVTFLPPNDCEKGGFELDNFARVLKSLVTIDSRHPEAQEYWEQCANLLKRIVKSFTRQNFSQASSTEPRMSQQPEIAHELKRYVP